MTPDELHALSARASQLYDELVLAREDRDAAACQLARHVSDVLADGKNHTMGSDPYLQAAVEVFNASWLGWDRKRDEWRTANDRVIGATKHAAGTV
jgi:hypothetical protein